MRKQVIGIAALALFASLAVGAFADGCPQLPTVTLPIDMYVPENHGLDGPRLWQLAVCSPAVYAQCGTIPASYVIEINGNGDGCDVGFNKDMSFGQWTNSYGGLNTFFSGTASIQDDRIVNVTLICDPAATTPTADGPVVAYSAQAGTVWNFDLRVKTSTACGAPNPPPPPPAPTSCPPLPLVTLPANQYVPENHGLDGPRLWQFSVCSPAAYSECGSMPASYVIEINGNGDGCDVGFNNDISGGKWTSAYGGMNTFFSGTASIQGDRVANVTLICDPNATTPTASGPAIAYSSQGGTVWTWDLRVKTSVACPSPPTPPPPPTPPLTPPPTPTPAPPLPPGQAAASRMQAVPVLGRDPSATATTAFPYSYNPSWFVSPEARGSRGCMLVRVQNYSHAGSRTPGPSSMAASCITADGDKYLSFEDLTFGNVVFGPSTPQEQQGTEDPRLAKRPDGTYLMFYTAVEVATTGAWIARLSLATSMDPLNPGGWTRYGALFPDVDGFQFTKSGALLVNPTGTSYLIFGDCSLYNGLQVATASPDFTSYTVIEDVLLVEKRPGMFDSALVESGPPPMQLVDGNWLFVYNAAQSLQGVPNKLFYNPGYVILNGSNPLQVLQRASVPLVMPSYIWETQGLTPFVVFVEAMRAGPTANTFMAYYGAADTNIGALQITVGGDQRHGYTVYADSVKPHQK